MFQAYSLYHQDTTDLDKYNRALDTLISPMDDLNRAALARRFQERLDVLNALLDKLEKLRVAHPLPHIPLTGLLRLPFEIRSQIYRHCIPRKRVVDISWPRFP
jgi:hypothetical protein